MTFNRERARQLLKEHQFQTLFLEELGWDHHRQQVSVDIEGVPYTLTAVAQKRGLVVFVCSPDPQRNLPDHRRRGLIEREVAKVAHEHLIIFADRARQIWQWVKREPGKPQQRREHTYYSAQTGEALLQKLQYLAVSLEEEESLTLTDVALRARQAFDVERVTKRFYDRFKTELDAFKKFLTGLPDDTQRSWYASVTLNRLMFLYFIQKKGFLNGDPDYLRNLLRRCQQAGEDRYYREYLCPLFFDALSTPPAQRSHALRQKLGDPPYLDGGLFQKHPLEEQYGDQLHIPDAAFERLYDFFDAYQWHLDERPTRADNEINPDVLGYIFEKYVNQKQMGAYYTKEDITEYISQNTILPRLLEMAQEGCAVAFEPNGEVWRLLQRDPDRYLYDALKIGVMTDKGEIVPETALPDFVQIGMHDPNARMFDARYNLQEADLRSPDGEKLTLPTETWREYIQRRQRCLELRQKLARGEIQSINDLITYNLHIRQFVQDVIETTEGPELLRAFWNALRRITILDPTVGSGAFLFAALNILYPLYEACLERMQSFVAEADLLGQTERYPDFRNALNELQQHPNPRYFIIKSIIVNNLYGVDIMEEAVEICKLRLFLKLAAQLDDPQQIEPLPNIDFNIRAGNTLVGYARIEDIDRLWRQVEDPQRHQSGRLGLERDHERLKQLVHEYALMLQMFRDQQLDKPTPRTVAKADLERARALVQPDLDKDLWRLYRTAGKLNAQTTLAQFQRTHKPFHWFLEFPAPLAHGGFDVIIGNPPYVEYSKVRHDYQILGYETEKCGNLYAYVVERCLNLAPLGARMGMIVPLSLTFSRDFTLLRRMLIDWSGHLQLSSYDNIPDRLFIGHKESTNTSKANQQRVTIFILHMTKRNREIYTTPLIRWRVVERIRLFKDLPFSNTTEICNENAFPKVGHEKMEAFLKRWLECPKRLGDLMTDKGEYSLAVPKTARYYIAAYEDTLDRTEQMRFYFDSPETRYLAVVLLNSNVFFWLWRVYGDGFHVTAKWIADCPVFEPRDHEYVEIAKQILSANPECISYKINKGLKIPSINLNKRLDLLCKADWWIIRHVAPDLGVTPEDFLQAKSNSLYKIVIPKAANPPEELRYVIAVEDSETNGQLGLEDSDESLDA